MALTYISYINLCEACDHKDQISIGNVQVPNEKKNYEQKHFVRRHVLSVDTQLLRQLKQTNTEFLSPKSVNYYRQDSFCELQT